MESWLNSKIKYEGRVVRLRVGEVKLDNGARATREVVEHSGGVAIVPVEKESVLLVRQFRIAAEAEILEIPAGRLEKNEPPETCAQRELEEEVGFRAGKLVRAVSYFSSVGFTNERMYIFLAFGLEKALAKQDIDERIRIEKIPLSEIKTALVEHRFQDSKTIIGLNELIHYFERNPR